MYQTLQDFLAALDAEGQLVRVAAPVSPILEIAQIAHRHARAQAPVASVAAAGFDPGREGRGGRALLFERVEGCDFPIAINVYGSYRRTEMALGCADGGFTAIAQRLGALAKPEPPSSLIDALSKGRQLLPLLRVPPRRVRRGVCQEVVRLTQHDQVDLTRLGLIKCWPLDGDPLAVGAPLSAADAGTAGGAGRYITFAGMHTVHADDRDKPKPPSHNVGMYRAQLVDRTRLVMHWHVHHDGAAHWRSWKKLGQPMPIAICFGGESVLPYAATAPMPPGMSELLMAGLLHGRGIPMVRAKTVPLWVPANSEIVIEGWVSTECGPIGWDPGGEEPLGPGAAFEGPFGDHTGFYSLPDRYPLVEVSAVTHRSRPVFPAIIVGQPPQEDYYLGKATERIFLPLLQVLIPDIVDYHLPLFGCFHNCAIVSIRKAYPLQARRVMHSIWGAGQMAWTKMIVVVDDDVDVHDEVAVFEAMFQRCHFLRDVEVVNGPLDILDHAAPRLGAGHKIGFDATAAIEGEDVAGIPAVAPNTPPAGEIEQVIQAITGKANIVRAVAPPFGSGRCLFIAVDKQSAGDGAAAITATWDAAVSSPTDLLVIVDADVDIEDHDEVFFRVGANFDPGRDLHRRGNAAALDATLKLPGDDRRGHAVRPFPPIIEMDQAVRDAVDARAGEFGLDKR
jgi:4-hydroxy-3-polyprenylbenzoate decarboxylase